MCFFGNFSIWVYPGKSINQLGHHPDEYIWVVTEKKNKSFNYAMEKK